MNISFSLYFLETIKLKSVLSLSIKRFQIFASESTLTSSLLQTALSLLPGF